jgi:transcriptional regulator with XRE-family HTH domain
MPKKKYVPLDHEDLRSAREDAGFSQHGLSRATGISQSTISKFESGQHVVDYEIYFQILDALDIRIEVTMPMPRTG